MPGTATQQIAANVRAERARHNVTQAAMAKTLGRSQASVSARLRGEIEISVSELNVLADLFGVPLSSLLAGVDTPAEAAAS